MTTPRRVPTRVLLLVGLAATLLVAGGLSLSSSTSPDGLERVATEQGLGEGAETGATADGPLTGYQAPGLDDSGLATVVAGVTGTLVVLVLGTALFVLVRRRRREPCDQDAPG